MSPPITEIPLENLPLPDVQERIPQEAGLPELPPLLRHDTLQAPGSITFPTILHPPLIEMPPLELQKLADRIRSYATPSVVYWHQMDNGAHAGSYMGHIVIPGMANHGLCGQGRQFYVWHRKYLADLSRQLALPGPIVARLPAQPSALSRPLPVPIDGPRSLPSWRPWEAIPKQFLVPAQLRGHLRAAANFPMRPADLLRFNTELCAYFDDLDGMAFCASWHWHFWVHYCMGGDMQNLDRAPNAPLFWCWHAFIDDTYEDWLRQKTRTEPPAEWPWPGEKPPLWPAAGDLVSTPWLFGNKLGLARLKLEKLGLKVGRTDQLCCDQDYVMTQKPFPFFPLQKGATVDLSSEMKGPFRAFPPPIEADPDAGKITVHGTDTVGPELRAMLMLETVEQGWPLADSLPPAMSRQLSPDRTQHCAEDHGDDDAGAQYDFGEDPSAPRGPHFHSDKEQALKKIDQ